MVINISHHGDNSILLIYLISEMYCLRTCIPSLSTDGPRLQSPSPTFRRSDAPRIASTILPKQGDLSADDANLSAPSVHNTDFFRKFANMISKAKVKFIKSLRLKKNREQARLFIAEGHKVVGELLASGCAHTIVATQEWLSAHPAPPTNELIAIDEEELRKVSLLQHPQQVLALFPFFDDAASDAVDTTSLSLMLDGVQDPGNLGTIIRIADWFGIGNIYCSTETADVYNPKVVQATMGSIARVRLHYGDLEAMLDRLPTDFPVYGTMLDGNDIYREPLSSHGLIIMGNEGNGISDEIGKRVGHRLQIPSYAEGCATAESLNVAVATAITCAEFRRRNS